MTGILGAQPGGGALLLSPLSLCSPLPHPLELRPPHLLYQHRGNSLETGLIASVCFSAK